MISEDVRAMPVDETVVMKISIAGLREIIGHLVEVLNVPHLSTITGQEVDGGIELLYHFWHGSGRHRVLLPLDALQIATVTDIIPGAAFYERKIVEMLGVTFVGHQDPLRLFLPDDWDGPPRYARRDHEEDHHTDRAQHPLLKEPVSFLLDVEGEQVLDSVLRLGYVHRGIERLAQERSYVQIRTSGRARLWYLLARSHDDLLQSRRISDGP